LLSRRLRVEWKRAQKHQLSKPLHHLLEEVLLLRTRRLQSPKRGNFLHFNPSLLRTQIFIQSAPSRKFEICPNFAPQSDSFTSLNAPSTAFTEKLQLIFHDY
jgi:hypothetical protein